MVSIWHLAYNHRPDDVRIFEKECKSLEKITEYKVTYVTSDKGLNQNDNIISISGVDLCIIPVVDSGKIKRIIKYIREMKNIIATHKNIDICQIHEFVLWIIIPFLKRNGIKVIIDAHEDDVNDVYRKMKNNYGRFIGGVLKWILEKYEKRFVRQADGFIGVTPYAIRKVEGFAKKTILLPNFPIINASQNSKSFDEYCKHANTLCFAGGISEIWSHEIVLKAMESIKNCNYIIAGTGTKEYIEKLEKFTAWTERTKFLGKVSHYDIYHNVYDKAGIGVALLTKDAFVQERKKEGTLGNTKLFEFMENSLPVICTNFSIWEKIVKENNCGIIIDPENVGEIENAIRYLIDNPKEAYEMGCRGRLAVERQFNWGNEEVQLYKFYAEILSE